MVDYTYDLTKTICIGGDMKTTLDLPADLLDEAMRIGGCRTKTATIVQALEQMVRSVKLAKLKSLRGTMPDFTLDLDTLRARA